MPDTVKARPCSATKAAVYAQFADRPTLRAVIAQRLSSSLLEKYPVLTLSVDQLRLAIPRDGGGHGLHPLLEVALQYLADGDYPDLSTRNNLECYLSDATGARLTFTATVDTPYDLNVIEAVIRELRWLVYIDFQDALARFWGQPDAPATSRWAWLSGLLQGNLREAAIRGSHNNEAQLQCLTSLTDYPDRLDRSALPWPGNGVHAYTLESQVTWAGHSVNVQACDILVTTAEQVWLCRISGEVEPYASLDDFGKSWGARLQQRYLADTVTWRQYEPDGSIFDNQAALVLNQQLEDLAETTLPARCSVAQMEQRFADITDPSWMFDGHSPTPAITLIEPELPQWLKKASPADRFAYRQCLLQQASFRKLANGDSYLKGLTSLAGFATEALNKQLRVGYRLAHPCEKGAGAWASSPYQADKLQLNFKVPVGNLGSGYLESIDMSLVDLALKNLSAKPKGKMTVTHSDGQALEEWLTPEYLLGVVQTIDIGKNYPHYIHEHLMGEGLEAQRRERLFSQQLPFSLVTQALEYKIRGEHGFTARGLQLVEAIVKPARAQRWVQTAEIVIRPLALLHKTGATADVVQNMFIIEARAIEAGPHLLYRPSYRESLLQFETRDALLAAIAKPGEVQDSVLTWLCDSARPIYSNGGFQEPHYVRIGMGSEFDLPAVPKPAMLAAPDDSSGEELLQSLSTGRLMQFLYGSEVRTMLDQAENDSTSNAESRWALILEGLQLALNTLLTVARGPIAIVGWMLQLAMSLKQDIPALESDDANARELAWIDLLLNVGMLLLHMGQRTEVPRRVSTDATRELALEPLRRKASLPFNQPPVIKRGTVGVASEPPGGGRTPLDFDRSLSGDSAAGRALEKLLAVSVPWPVPVPEPISVGEFQGLYKRGMQWHASVGGLLFSASVVPGFGEVYIIDPKRPGHPGIKLKSLGHGRWVLDRGLKLVGGGPKRIQSARQKLQEKTDELENRGRQLAAEFSALAEPHTQLNRSLQDASDTLAVQRKKLHEAWNLLEHANEAQKPFVTKLHTQAKLRRQSARTQLKVLLDTFRDRLPKTNELLLGISKVMKDLADVGKVVPGGEQQLQLIWQDLSFMREMLSSASKDLAFSDDGERMQDLLGRVYPDDGGPLVDLNASYEYRANTLQLFNTWNEEANVASSMESLLEQLNDYSPGGRALRRKLLATIDSSMFFAKNVKLRANKVLLILGFDKHIEPQSPQEDQYLEHLDRPDLYKVLSTHIEVRSHDGYSPKEQREVYETLISKYRGYEGAISALLDIHSSSMISPYSEQFLQRLHEARALAQGELEDVVRKQEELEVKLPLAKTLKARKSTKRVFKTRKKEYLIGDFRPAGGKNANDHIIMTDAATGDVIASYEANEDGWSEPAAVEQVRPASPQEQSLPTLRDQGSHLVQQRPGIERWVRSQHVKLDSPLTREDVNPADWSALLTRHANKLEAIADALQQHHPDSQTAIKLIEEYRAHARDLSRWAEQVCSDAYKRQLPSMEGLQYLWDHKQIDINLTSRADPQRPTLSGDFFTEYAVYDKAAKPPKVLWYAHFHYASADVDAVCTRAHLKLPEQRKYTQKDLLKSHVQADLLERTEPGAEPLGKIIYVLITEPQDQLFLAIAPTQGH